jgi:hypothetical protein
MVGMESSGVQKMRAWEVLERMLVCTLRKFLNWVQEDWG